MSALGNKTAIRIAILALAIVAPFALPAFQVELTFLWIMIVFALSWDIMGGQAGYNSFGNIAFFGIGVYAATILQIGLFHDVAAYTAAAGGEKLGRGLKVPPPPPPPTPVLVQEPLTGALSVTEVAVMVPPAPLVPVAVIQLPAAMSATVPVFVWVIVVVAA